MRLFTVLFFLAIPGFATASPFVPVIANSGFEEVVPGNDAPHWGWYARCRASFRSDTENPHSGKRCLVFNNLDELAPEVYARLYQGIGTLPGTRYELTVWVRGEDVAKGIHFTDWKSYMLEIPAGTYGWQKVSKIIETPKDEGGINLGINVTNKCKALAIDDISLRPVGVALKGHGIDGSLFFPGRIGNDTALSPLGIFVNSTLEETATIMAIITAGNEVIFKKKETLKPGTNSFEWQWTSDQVVTRELQLKVQVLDTLYHVKATTIRKIEKTSPKVVLADIERAQKRLNEFDALMMKCGAKGIPLDYPMSARTTLTQFIPLARRDVEKGDLRRADYAVKDFNRILDESLAELRICLQNPKSAPKPIRYRTGKLEIDGLSFIGSRKDNKGNITHGPVFFCGYGHFSQVRKDIPRFPGYGVNIIQVEIGPSSVLISENDADLNAVKDIARVLDNAAAHNIMVNVLLSPHYFPQWAHAKWSHLAKGGGGFLGFCVDDSAAKQVIEKYLRIVVPMLKDKPALHSFCLSNEPLFDRGAGCDNTKELWAAYLARVHGTVEAMNTCYGSRYADFNEVPIPWNGDYGAPQMYDYSRFNQERFAGWHKWMADIIHEMAPDIPIHAKMMWIPISWRHSSSMGIDPEMFGELSQINGNDCVIWPGSGDWGISWSEQNMFFDLQRSANRKPIFNSENHLQPDGSTDYVAPEHYRTALWQGAIHGQGATTIWVWERTADPTEPHYAATVPFYGNVMDRPGCAHAVGTTCLDLNRFAEEVSALQSARAPVAVLYSMASFIKQNSYLGAVSHAYSALNFLGVKVDFITEKQLAAGKGSQYKMIVIPQAEYIPESAFNALKALPGTTRLVIIGDALRKDPYGREFDEDNIRMITAKSLLLSAQAPAQELMPLMQKILSDSGALPDVAVVDVVTGKPVWGVEWLTAETDNRTVMNIVNLTSKPVSVKLMRQGITVDARNLLSLGGLEKVRTLKPITPVLAEVSQ